MSSPPGLETQWIGFASPPGLTRSVRAGFWPGLEEVRGSDFSAVVALLEPPPPPGTPLDPQFCLSHQTSAEQLGTLLAHQGRFAPWRSPVPRIEADLVRAAMLAHTDRIRRHLEWSQSVQEWRIGLFLEPTAVPTATAPGHADPNHFWNWVSIIWGDVIADTLQDATLRILQGTTRHGMLVSDSGILCVDAACLIEAEHSQAFRRAVEVTNAAIEGMKLHIEYGGPFPPFRFAPTPEELFRAGRSSDTRRHVKA
ncbi:MAG: GvpL/GvpF family gas vesicle protein [Planctomycetes bacterium]|nr:GvpL/GvpF family gas vesicle protein [Planctomycetota bacterium]